ncbi:putative plastid light harvesting protein [Pelagophyceae sp. CCMP2097]|nr:putative plastid light harvesting protein [Pelagophyceae sp. CCMP2097]
MQLLVLALALSSAAAFVAPQPAAAATRLQENKQDLIALQESLPGPPGFWDPLSLAGSEVLSPWLEGQDATIGFLRHAEIKHGRVAMAAFLGFCAQSTPLVSGEHAFLPYKGYIAGCTPQEQWDNVPLLGKLQIFTLIGLLESYGEGAGDPAGYVHYTKGGVPGYYPPIKGRVGGQILFNLWDPFTLPGGPSSMTPERKARGLKSELLNGRAAQMGILGLLSESAVPGSVPFLSGVEGFPRYAGEVMAPFSHDFHLFQ